MSLRPYQPPQAGTNRNPFRRIKKDQRTDINAAPAETLQLINGIGPALAVRIVEHRARDPFRSVDDLVKVRGINSVLVERIRSEIKV